MRRRIGLAIVVGAVIAIDANAAQPADEITGSLAAAWNRGDAVAWGEQFWPDARFVNVLAHVYEGRAQIVAQHARIFQTIYKGSHLAVTGVHNRVLDADHALIEMDSAGTGMSRLPPGLVAVDGIVRSHMILVGERRHGAWKIVYAQNTGYTPLPAPPPGH